MSAWVEGKYSNWRRALDGGMVLTVAWDALRPKGNDDPPYIAHVGDRRLKQRFVNLPTAKAETERIAESFCNKALADLRAATAHGGPPLRSMGHQGRGTGRTANGEGQLPEGSRASGSDHGTHGEPGGEMTERKPLERKGYWPPDEREYTASEIRSLVEELRSDLMPETELFDDKDEPGEVVAAVPVPDIVKHLDAILARLESKP